MPKKPSVSRLCNFNSKLKFHYLSLNTFFGKENSFLNWISFFPRVTDPVCSFNNRRLSSVPNVPFFGQNEIDHHLLLCEFTMNEWIGMNCRICNGKHFIPSSQSASSSGKSTFFVYNDEFLKRLISLFEIFLPENNLLKQQ